MATLSLKLTIGDDPTEHNVQFDPTTIVFDACKIIRDRIPQANITQNPLDCGLFLSDEDVKKGVWLEPGRTLEYYLLRNQDKLEYKKKQRILRVRMLDGAVKTLHVDDSHVVKQLMITICTRIGITNHEEYSLVRELPDEEREKTLTLRRGQSIAKDQKKLDEMKRKLHTEDEVNWLDHSKTLREQAVDVSETLLLRRKFFFSDQNVDARDPVQLNLLYVQTRDAIVVGAHPITQEEAVRFAGIQCQIQFGDHNPNKHKSGFLDLKEFLPKEYAKIKGIEKKVFKEHKSVSGLSEIDGKVKYTQLARSLKTYGITFFLVKEKMRGKNKLVPCLLGITKESVVRVDAKTKEITKTWPLTTVKRWVPSPNTFTLDLGDYADSFYSVQTTDGEKISQLISGYVDIILKKKKAKDHFGIEGDEESTMYEDSVSPAKATIIQHQSSRVGHANMESVALPAVLRAGGGGPGAYSTGVMQQAQYSQVTNHHHPKHAPHTDHYASSNGQNAEEVQLTQAQRALLGNIDAGLSAISDANANLQDKAKLPQLGDDQSSRQWKKEKEDLTKQNVESQLSAMNAATVQVVTLTGQPEDTTDYNAVGSAVATISSNIGEFSRDMQLLAALQETDSDGDRLMEAARKLAGAFTDLLKAAQPATQQPRQDLLTAASTIGEQSTSIMRSVGYDETDSAYEETLIMLAKAVANATATLVLKVKDVTGQCDDQYLREQVIANAARCAQSTSQLVACTKAVAPTIHNPVCQDQLKDAAKIVVSNVDHLVDSAQSACTDEGAMSDLMTAASEVTQSLNQLLSHITQYTTIHTTTHEEESSSQAAEVIITATDRLFSSVGDKEEMVRQAKILAQATSQLVNAIKSQADQQTDSEQQKKLLAAAKQLADATAKLVEAAKGCATNPPDAERHTALKQAADEVKVATYAANTGTMRRKLIRRLETAAKNAASATTQLINCASGATQYNTNKQQHTHIMQKSKNIADTAIPELVQGIRATMTKPDSSAAHMRLINASQALLQPGSELVSQCKSSLSTITDDSMSLSVRNSAHSLTQALTELRTAALKAQSIITNRNSEIDAALEQVKALHREITDYITSNERGTLAALPADSNQSRVSYESRVGATSKTVGSLMAQLLSAADKDNAAYTGIAARDTAHELKVLTQAIRGVATAPHTSPQLREQILNTALDVMSKSEQLIDEAKNAIDHPNNPDNKARLAQVAKAVSQALNNCVGCLPDIQDIDTAIKYVTTVNMRLVNGQFIQSGVSYAEAQSQLSNNAVALNQAATDIVTASHHTTRDVAKQTKRYSQTYEIFLDSGLQLCGVTPDTDTKDQLVSSLKSVSLMSNKLIHCTRTHLVDPNAPNSRNMLTQAARGVTESINHLIDVCTVSSPGQKECDNALRQIQSTRTLLENPSEPVSELSYYDCLNGVINHSKLLGVSMPGISKHAKDQQITPFCDDVREFAKAVCGVAENAAQAAYLVGIADGASEPGRPGLVDQSQFVLANQAIQNACLNLTNPTTTQQQDIKQLVLSAATIIARYTSSLCNTCRQISAKTSNPVAKQHFIKSAKDVANNTANLVKAIKTLDNEFTEENRRLCSEAAKPLISAVEQLTTFAASPEFASVPARISKEAQKAQEPLTQSGLSLVDGACEMIQAAKQLCAKPDDPSIYQLYSKYSTAVSDSIKHMIANTKSSAPGQIECDAAMTSMKSSIRDLDTASLSAVSQSLRPQSSQAHQTAQEQLTNSVQELGDMVDPVKRAGCSEAEKLGHLVSIMSDYVTQLSSSAITVASNTQQSKLQTTILDQSKTVCECALQLVYAAKESGGNHKAVKTHQSIEEAAQSLHNAIADLSTTLEDVASASGMVHTMMDTISKALAKTEQSVIPPNNMSFVDFQTSLVKLARQIARCAQDMLGKTGADAAQLGPICTALTRDYGHLAHETAGAVATAPSREVGATLKSLVQDLGAECRELVKVAGQVQSNPQDTYSANDLSAHVRKVAEKVSAILRHLQLVSRGTQACINAASTVSGIIGDLDTTIMFATAGTLSAEGGVSFSDHREDILKTAKSLVEDTKTLVSGAAGNQDQLAGAAQTAMMTIIKLADCVKHGAASLGSEQPEAQVSLINAVKDVAQALGDLISATKNASGKPSQDPAMGMLKDNAKVMVTNVTSLLKTVKTVEDEASRGTRALEGTIEAISQELRNYNQTDRVEKIYSPEDLIRATKPLTLATGKAVSAGNSGQQDEVIVVANTGRKAIKDMLTACKGAAAGSDSADARQTAIQAGHHCATQYKQLLQQVATLLQNPSAENRQQLADISKSVAQAVTQLVFAAEALKGNDWVSPDDLTAIAEMELLGAANSIEAAAKKLSELQPRRQPQQPNENLKFDQQILEAATCIANATAALVKSASAAQRELIAQGKVGRGAEAKYKSSDEDDQWSQGLISAARMVAAATHSLCDAANAMVQGHASEEKLISAAKEVAASTAQLLVASKVRADADSEAMRRLQKAGHAVKRATDVLVEASLRAKRYTQYEEDLTVNTRMVSGITQIINIKEEILTKEKELNQARHKLETIRRAKYKGQSEDEDGYGSNF